MNNSVENFPFKYPESQEEIELNKKWFNFDLLWSVTTGHRMKIDNIIGVYLNRPIQTEIEILIQLFGFRRVIMVLERLKEYEFQNYLTDKQKKHIIASTNEKRAKELIAHIEANKTKERNRGLRAIKRADRMISYYVMRVEGKELVPDAEKIENFFIEPEQYVIDYVKKHKSEEWIESRLESSEGNMGDKDFARQMLTYAERRII